MTTEVVYESEITALGSEVAAFAEMGMLVLFSEAAPDELRDIAVIHSHPGKGVAPQAGDDIEIDGRVHKVTAVGDVVGENFRELGHATLKANGYEETELPGDISVEVGQVTLPTVGAKIKITRSGIAT